MGNETGGRILITGATGFVGQSLLPLLSKNRLRVAVRQISRSVAGLESVPIGNIDDRTAWGEALHNVECIVHLAARVHVMNPTSEDSERFYRTNVLGTERLALAAVANGVKRFIFLSSIKVNGEQTHDAPFSVASEPCPLDDYGTSKYFAEQRLSEIAAQSKMEVVIIRPPLVYGVGVRANFRRLLALIDSGFPLPLGAIRNQRSLVSVWNLCDLIRMVIEIPSIRSGVLLVSDGEDLSTPELIRRIAAKMGRTPRLLPFHLSVLKVIGGLTGKGAEISRLCDSLVIDISATRRELNWNPPMSVDESLWRTAQWYLHGGKNSE